MHKTFKFKISFTDTIEGYINSTSIEDAEKELKILFKYIPSFVIEEIVPSSDPEENLNGN